MLNTYHYFSGGFAAFACLSGALIHYPLSDPPVSTVSSEAIETLEISDRGSGRLTLELAYADSSQEDDIWIADRGSGRVIPAPL
ncbi:MAG: hypothetical protein WA949_03825 [Phormidesmis sp.]